MSAVCNPSVFTMSAPSPGGRKRDESVWQFLERSTEAIAADTRARCDAWLARMPAGPRNSLVHRLKDRHDAKVRDALAELVTFVLLDSIYPSVDVEPATGTGSYTDFAVNLPVRTHFEVRRKSPSEALSGDARRRADIAAELEKIESPDFWLDVDAHSGATVPRMRPVRQKVKAWLDSLDYDKEAGRAEQERQARQSGSADEMPGLDAGPQERAKYLAARPPYQPPTFEDRGQGWYIRIGAYPREAESRGPGQFTVGVRSAGEAHIETADSLERGVRDKLKQHAGLADPLVVVLDLSSPIADDLQISAMLYGPVTATMLTPMTVLSATRDRKRGIWPVPLSQPTRPAAVLVLRGIWLASHAATAELWLPPGATSPLLPGPWDVRTLGPDQQPVTIRTATALAADYLNQSL